MGGLDAFPAGGLVIGVGLAAIWSAWPGGPRPAAAVVATLVWAPAWPALAGAGVAAAQWAVLSPYLRGADARGWVRTNAILWLTGTVVARVVMYLGSVPLDALARGHGPFAVASLPGLILGIAVALGQWATLEDGSPRAWIWLPAVPAGYAVGTSLGAFAAAAALRGVRIDDWALTFLAAPAVGGAVGGCVSAAITGLALVWLARADPEG